MIFLSNLVILKFHDNWWNLWKVFKDLATSDFSLSNFATVGVKVPFQSIAFGVSQALLQLSWKSSCSGTAERAQGSGVANLSMLNQHRFRGTFALDQQNYNLSSFGIAQYSTGIFSFRICSWEIPCSLPR